MRTTRKEPGKDFASMASHHILQNFKAEKRVMECVLGLGRQRPIIIGIF